MNEPYAILLQKEKETEANDSIKKWGIACRKFPFKLDGGSKDLASRDWPGEDGDDVFYPEELKLKAYDIETELVYVGNLGECADNMLAFRDYLTGADGLGVEMRIFNSHTGIGRKGCHWLEMSDLTFNKEEDEEVLQFTMKIKVSDPKTRIVAQTTDVEEMIDGELVKRTIWGLNVAI